MDEQRRGGEARAGGQPHRSLTRAELECAVEQEEDVGVLRVDMRCGLPVRRAQPVELGDADVAVRDDRRGRRQRRLQRAGCCLGIARVADRANDGDAVRAFATTSSTFAASMPPIANHGSRAAYRAVRMSSSPAVALSGFVGVEKIVPTPM